MRYIQLGNLIKTIFANPDGKKEMQRLTTAHETVKTKPKNQRQKYIEKNGSSKWSPIKNRMTKRLGNKCWYTEVELVGADLTIDHYRPKRDYWWLAFDVDNYRVACPYSNSKKHNPLYGCGGGKGDDFPLRAPSVRATSKRKIKCEKPIILDPCNKDDCNLLVFQADGRPKLNPVYAADHVAVERVERSMLLLNLDHPDFNTKREQLYLTIKGDVDMYEALPAGSPSRNLILDRMKDRLSAKAAFSSAARHYLQFHRHLDWVENLLNK